MTKKEFNMERAKRLVYGAPTDEPELVYGYVRVSEDDTEDGEEMRSWWEESNIIEQVVISIMPKDDVECWGIGEMMFQWRKPNENIFYDFDMSNGSFAAFSRIGYMMTAIFETFDLNPTPEGLIDSLAIHGFVNLLEPSGIHLKNEKIGYEIDILPVTINDEICAITIDNFSTHPVTIQNYNILELNIDENWENIYNKALQKFTSYQNALDEFEDEAVIHFKILNVLRERGYVEY